MPGRRLAIEQRPHDPDQTCQADVDRVLDVFGRVIRERALQPDAGRVEDVLDLTEQQIQLVHTASNGTFIRDVHLHRRSSAACQFRRRLTVDATRDDRHDLALTTFVREGGTESTETTDDESMTVHKDLLDAPCVEMTVQENEISLSKM